MVFSSRAVNSATKYIREPQDTGYRIRDIKIPKTRNPKPVTRKQLTKIKRQIQTLMWNNVGIIRQEKKMRETLKILNKYHLNIIPPKPPPQNGINKEIVGLKNLCQVAILITEAALARKKSVGTHYLEK